MHRHGRDRAPDALGQRHRLVARHCNQRDRELIPAHACDQIALAQLPAESLRDRFEHLIADGMPVGVVHRLESVEIEDRDRETGWRLELPPADIAQAVEKFGAILQAGHRIGGGALMQPHDGPRHAKQQRADQQAGQQSGPEKGPDRLAALVAGDRAEILLGRLDRELPAGGPAPIERLHHAMVHLVVDGERDQPLAGVGQRGRRTQQRQRRAIGHFGRLRQGRIDLAPEQGAQAARRRDDPVVVEDQRRPVAPDGDALHELRQRVDRDIHADRKGLRRVVGVVGVVGVCAFDPFGACSLSTIAVAAVMPGCLEVKNT